MTQTLSSWGRGKASELELQRAEPRDLSPGDKLLSCVPKGGDRGSDWRLSQPMGACTYAGRPYSRSLGGARARFPPVAVHAGAHGRERPPAAAPASR